MKKLLVMVTSLFLISNFSLSAADSYKAAADKRKKPKQQEKLSFYYQLRGLVDKSKMKHFDEEVTEVFVQNDVLVNTPTPSHDKKIAILRTLLDGSFSFITPDNRQAFEALQDTAEIMKAAKEKKDAIEAKQKEQELKDQREKQATAQARQEAQRLKQEAQRLKKEAQEEQKRQAEKAQWENFLPKEASTAKSAAKLEKPKKQRLEELRQQTEKEKRLAEDQEKRDREAREIQERSVILEAARKREEELEEKIRTIDKIQERLNYMKDLASICLDYQNSLRDFIDKYKASLAREESNGTLTDSYKAEIEGVIAFLEKEIDNAEDFTLETFRDMEENGLLLAITNLISDPNHHPEYSTVFSAIDNAWKCSLREFKDKYSQPE
ncbi:MAG: hypothetical protein EBU90_08990 [Proteobacteria bacterium]|nr:hypothetical protein [Pseudomonadota bacterium]NBP14075.1 hypothetical protein [bacterium]